MSVSAAMVFANQQSIYLVMYLLLSILGLVVSPYFYCAHLLDIAWRNDLLRVRHLSRRLAEVPV